jgi:hypothetical protein
MGSIWLYGGFMMNFIKRIRWMNLCLWVSILGISFTIWYYLIKLIRSVL